MSIRLNVKITPIANEVERYIIKKLNKNPPKSYAPITIKELNSIKNATIGKYPNNSSQITDSIIRSIRSGYMKNLMMNRHHYLLKNSDKIIKEYKNYTKDFLSGLEDVDKAQIEKLGLPELSLKQPTELYGKKRTAQLLEQGLDLPASYKELGYSIKVPKGTATLKEFINDPNVRNKAIQMISDLACGVRRQAMGGGRINFSEGSDCFNKGLKILEEGNLNKQQITLAERAIAGADEAAPILKNILGKAGSGIKFTGIGIKELISVGAGPIGLGVGALLEAGQAVPELAKGDWREAIRSTTLGFLPESIVGSKRTDLLRMAKTDEEKNAAQ